MEIIKRGELPEEKSYTTACGNCKTEFRFKQSEGKVTHDQRDGSFVTINCPLCHKPVHVNY